MTTPEFLPVLSAGSHEDPREGACVMEYVSMLAGEPFTDTPACTHPMLARVAQVVNDRLSDEDRHLLVPLIGRLFGTADTRTDEMSRVVLSVRLAVWCARSVLPLVRKQDRGACAAAIDAAEAWADDPTEKNAHAAVVARDNAYTATDAAYAAAYAASYAYYPPAAVDVAAAAYDAYAYAYNASYAYNTAVPVARVEFLTGLLDEHDRLTGHVPTTVDTDTLVGLAEKVGTRERP